MRRAGSEDPSGGVPGLRLEATVPARRPSHHPLFGRLWLAVVLGITLGAIAAAAQPGFGGEEGTQAADDAPGGAEGDPVSSVLERAGGPSVPAPEDPQAVAALTSPSASGTAPTQSTTTSSSQSLLDLPWIEGTPASPSPTSSPGDGGSSHGKGKGH